MNFWPWPHSFLSSSARAATSPSSLAASKVLTHLFDFLALVVPCLTASLSSSLPPRGGPPRGEPSGGVKLSMPLPPMPNGGVRSGDDAPPEPTNELNRDLTPLNIAHGMCTGRPSADRHVPKKLSPHVKISRTFSCREKKHFIAVGVRSQPEGQVGTQACKPHPRKSISIPPAIVWGSATARRLTNAEREVGGSVANSQGFPTPPCPLRSASPFVRTTTRRFKITICQPL